MPTESRSIAIQTCIAELDMVANYWAIHRDILFPAQVRIIGASGSSTCAKPLRFSGSTVPVPLFSNSCSTRAVHQFPPFGRFFQPMEHI